MSTQPAAKAADRRATTEHRRRLVLRWPSRTNWGSDDHDEEEYYDQVDEYDYEEQAYYQDGDENWEDYHEEEVDWARRKTTRRRTKVRPSKPT